MLCCSLSLPISKERERKHLAEFLEDYDDVKDDQRYYKYSNIKILLFLLTPMVLPV